MPACEHKSLFIVACSVLSSYVSALVFAMIFLLQQEASAEHPQHAEFQSAPDTIRTAAQSAQWTRLLHYGRNALGQYKSRVANQDFFLSPNGKWDPEAELLATLNAFSAEDRGNPEVKRGALGLSASCNFPARRMFVERALGFPAATRPCVDFENWKNGIAARGVSLVFSSAYPGSPGSLFGHTFLKFSRSQFPASQAKIGIDGRNEEAQFSSAEMLDYSLSFAAATGDSGPLAYFAYGLTGGFNGVFSLAPFYVKAQEYNAAEGRDLWIYDLRLEQKQVQMLISHQWELMNLAVFPYYFFDENCASMLLDILEVAQPKWNLRSRFLYAVLPGESIKALDDAVDEAGDDGNVGDFEGKAILNARHLPSVVSEFRNAWDSLDTKQRDEFQRSLESPATIDTVQSATLHALVKLSEWQKMRAKGILPENEMLIRKRTLRALAKAEISEQPRVAPIAGDPRLGHGPTRIKLTYGLQSPPESSKNSPAQRLNLEHRFGFHGNQDPSLGYEPGLSIEYLRIKASAEDRKFWLSEFTALEAQSLVQFEPLGRQISYRTSFSFLDNSTPEDPGAAIEFQAGPGIAATNNRPGSNAALYALAIPSIRLGLTSRAPKSRSNALAKPGEVAADVKLALGAKHSLPLDGMLLIEAQPSLRSGWNLKLDISFGLWPATRKGWPVTVVVQEITLSNPWSDGVKRLDWAINWGGSILF